ncbi:phosphoesterase, putative [hydrothermal vent metagenome]|uniref:Phosphoesterase, putative n=1 Tax=hydrothermal vent metagenome TaxID=652676 RepID=A0A1W1DVI4_9ZZZZ
MNRCDKIIHAGDIMEENTLKAFTAPLIAVRGNNDEHLAFADIETLDLPGGKLVVEHGHKHGWQTPSHDALRAAHAEAKVIVYGHTHKQLINTEISPWIVNPGASGAIRNRGSSKCLVLAIDDKQNWKFITHNFTNGV